VNWGKAVAGEAWRNPGLTNCASAVARLPSPEADGIIASNGVPEGIPNSAVGIETDNAVIG
jgi:hypothetical protein